MRKNFFGLLALLLLPLSSMGAAPEAVGTTPEICQAWFTAWADASRASLTSELKLGKELGFEKRELAEAGKGIDSVVEGAKVHCARLAGYKLRGPNKGETPAKNCDNSFKEWEEQRDQAYTTALFDKKFIDESAKFMPAQEVARREAKLARIHCQALSPLH